MSGVDPQDLLVLLAVARGRTHTAAGISLGMNHTTVARRVRALERASGQRLLVPASGGWELTQAGRATLQAAEAVEAALTRVPGGRGDEQASTLHGLVRVSSTELFGVEVVAGALAEVHLSHPDISFELISLTRPAPQYGPSADLEIGVTRPASRRLEVTKILDYKLGLFAARSYFEDGPPSGGHPMPRRVADLAGHTPIYYVESMLQVVELDLIDRLFPKRGELLGATSVLAQLEIVRAGAGIAILPVYLARKDPTLVQVMPGVSTATLTYWMSGRAENVRRPEVQATARAILDRSRRVIAGPRASRR